MEQLSPILYTADLPGTLEFYTGILFFELISGGIEEKWAMLRSGAVELMISVPNSHIPFPQAMFTGSFYFRVKEVDTYWNALKDKVNICYPLENFDYGMREFAFYDNNGYLLQFGSPASNRK